MKTIQPTTDQLRMLASIKGHQWMIREDAIPQFALAALDVPSKCELSIDLSDFFEIRPQAGVDDGGVGHSFIKGVLMSGGPAIYEKLGMATRYETIIGETRALVEAGAKGILYHVNSPGGTVTGNVEACEAIESAGVPTAAHCSVMSCSAAYKLSSSTGQIVADPSAEVGNIGTILSWADCDEFWKEMGVEFKALTNEGADLKSTFHLEPDEAQLAFLQERLNEHGEEFRAHVEAGRARAGATLDAEVFRAGWYSGALAGDLGLVDDIAGEDIARAGLIARFDTPDKIEPTP